MNGRIRKVTVTPDRPGKESPIRVTCQPPDTNGIKWVSIECDSHEEMLMTQGEARRLAAALLTVVSE